jgi:hypothetical protein
MYERLEKPKENRSRAFANSVTQKKSDVKQGFGFVDNRPEVITHNKLQEKVQRRNSQNSVVQREGIWDETSVNSSGRTELTADEYAEGLTRDSKEFSKLRDTANEQINKHYGRNLDYKNKPENGGGSSEAYFKDDSVYFNMEGHPAMILANLIFETANAAQAGNFINVEADYKSGAIMNKSPNDYGFDDLGKKLSDEYADGDAETRRAIVQERFEWHSFTLATPSFKKAKTEMAKEEQSKKMYEMFFAAFDHMLDMNSFEEYYDEYGWRHRKSVEGELRRVAEQERTKCGCCYITTACVEAKGLSDNCEELTVLRDFRDTYLLNKENGRSLIETYYKYSPQIVNAIKRREDEEEILARLYRIIKNCVDAIKKGDNEYAFKAYCKMVVELKDEFLHEVEVPFSSS